MIDPRKSVRDGFFCFAKDHHGKGKKRGLYETLGMYRERPRPPGRLPLGAASGGVGGGGGGLPHQPRYSIASVFGEDRFMIMSQVKNRKRERYKQMGRMLSLVLVPVLALIAVTAVLLSQAVNKDRTTAQALDDIDCLFSAGRLIDAISDERGATASYLLDRKAESLSRLHVRQELVDLALPAGNCWPKHRAEHAQQAAYHLRSKDDLTLNLQQLRQNMTLGLPFEECIHIYNALEKALVAWIIDSVMLPGDRVDIWTQVAALKALLRVKILLGSHRSLGEAAMYRCQLDKAWFMKTEGEISAFLQETFSYQPELNKRFEDATSSDNEYIQTMSTMKDALISDDFSGVCNSTPWDDRLIQKQLWTSSVDKYIATAVNLQTTMTGQLKEDLAALRHEARRTMIIYSVVAVCIVVVCALTSLWYASCIQHLTHTLSLYALTSTEKSRELANEKQKTDTLLHEMMPKTVADQLKENGEVEAEYFESVTICFTDIVGFTFLASISSPQEIVDLLNTLYSIFDKIIEHFDVYKVETIGDAYMVVSGLPERITTHAVEIADMALEMKEAVQGFCIPHQADQELAIRIGMHTGPCMAGVVGRKMPRYTLFGDTVNVASRMESTSEAHQIQLSQDTRNALLPAAIFVMEKRGDIDIKGKGLMTTYWLKGKDHNLRNPSGRTPRRMSIVTLAPIYERPERQALLALTNDKDHHKDSGLALADDDTSQRTH